MEELKPEDLTRRVEQQAFDPHATTEAANLLADLRLKYADKIPLAAWRMMTSAESIMNKELDRYFKPKDDSKPTT